MTVVFVLQLAGCFAGTIDSMLGQFAPGRRVNRIANLLRAGGCGGNEEFRLQSRFLYQVFHHELGHWTAADVAVADK